MGSSGEESDHQPWWVRIMALIGCVLVLAWFVYDQSSRRVQEDLDQLALYDAERVVQQAASEAEYLERRYKRELVQPTPAKPVTRFQLFQSRATLAEEDLTWAPAVVEIVETILTDPSEGSVQDLEVAFVAERLIELALTTEVAPYRGVLAKVRTQLIEQAYANGFNPVRRYRDAEVYEMSERGERDPFWCSPLLREITLIGQISELTHASDALGWKIAYADALATNHACENGEPAPDGLTAFRLYTEIGHTGDATRVAMWLAEDRIIGFGYGWDRFGKTYEDLVPLNGYDLDEAVLWLERAGQSPVQIREFLTAYADQFERQGYNQAASALYERAGDVVSVERLKPLVATSPRPTFEQEGQAFLLTLGAAETHPR